MFRFVVGLCFLVALAQAETYSGPAKFMLDDRFVIVGKIKCQHGLSVKMWFETRFSAMAFYTLTYGEMIDIMPRSPVMLFNPTKPIDYIKGLSLPLTRSYKGTMTKTNMDDMYYFFVMMQSRMGDPVEVHLHELEYHCEESSSKLSTGAIVAITMSCIVLSVSLAALVYLKYFRKK